VIFVFNSEKYEVKITVGELAAILKSRIKVKVWELLGSKNSKLELRILLPESFKNTEFVQSGTLFLDSNVILSNEFFIILGGGGTVNVETVLVPSSKRTSLEFKVINQRGQSSFYLLPITQIYFPLSSLPD